MATLNIEFEEEEKEKIYLKRKNVPRDSQMKTNRHKNDYFRRITIN